MSLVPYTLCSLAYSRCVCFLLAVNIHIMPEIKKNIAVCDVCNVAQNVFEILVYVYSKLQHNLSLLFS